MKIRDIVNRNYKIIKELDLSQVGVSSEEKDSEFTLNYDHIIDEVLRCYQLSLSKGLPNQLAESISVELFKVFIQYAIQID